MPSREAAHCDVVRRSSTRRFVIRPARWTAAGECSTCASSPHQSQYSPGIEHAAWAGLPQRLPSRCKISKLISWCHTTTFTDRSAARWMTRNPDQAVAVFRYHTRRTNGSTYLTDTVALSFLRDDECPRGSAPRASVLRRRPPRASHASPQRRHHLHCNGASPQCHHVPPCRFDEASTAATSTLQCPQRIYVLCGGWMRSVRMLMTTDKGIFSRMGTAMIIKDVLMRSGNVPRFNHI
jgi:hypothetical protein